MRGFGSEVPDRPARQWLFLGLASLLAASLTAGCSSGTPSGEVVLYTSMPEAIVEQLAGVIERRFPDLDGNYWLPSRGGISLTVVRGRTADLEERIAQELAAGELGADVIWLAEPSPYEAYKADGLLAPYEPPDGAPIIADFVDPDGFYVAGRVMSMVIAWNTTMRPTGLDDWTDLYEVGSTAFPGPDSGAARATINALVDTYGLDYFASLSAAGGVSVESNGRARDGVVAGEFEAVAVLDYMARRAKSEGWQIDFAYPSSGTVVIPSPLAILEDAPNRDAAKVFVDFILSKSGQEIIVQLGSFYPVRSDVDPPVGAVPLDRITAFETNWSRLAAETDAIPTMWADIYGSS